MTWLLAPLEDTGALDVAERTLAALIAANPLSSSGTQLQMLGYLRNREDYPEKDRVSFVSSACLGFLARVEDSGGRLIVSACVSRAVNGGSGPSGDDLYA